MRQRGLEAYRLSQNRVCWFYSSTLLPDKKISVKRAHGKSASISLWGYSERYKAYWHFAIEADAQKGEPDFFALKPHVVFTTDGRVPFERASVQHRLRRSFCKSWWNDRWRNLMQAFVESLSADGTIRFGRDFADPLETRDCLSTLISPVSLSGRDSGVDAPEDGEEYFYGHFDFEDEHWGEEAEIDGDDEGPLDE